MVLSRKMPCFSCSMSELATLLKSFLARFSALVKYLKMASVADVGSVDGVTIIRSSVSPVNPSTCVASSREASAGSRISVCVGKSRACIFYKHILSRLSQARLLESKSPSSPQHTYLRDHHLKEEFGQWSDKLNDGCVLCCFPEDSREGDCVPHKSRIYEDGVTAALMTGLTVGS